MINDEFRGQLTSSNGTGPRGVLGRHPGNQQERKQNLKHAIFCLAVAVLLFLANQLAKHSRANGYRSGAVLNIGVDLSVDRGSTPIRASNDPTDKATYVIRFRLTIEETTQFSIPYTPAQIGP